MDRQFEASGNFNEWPQNAPGKPTQAAVFGIGFKTDSKRPPQTLWTGKFNDLNTAMYWAAKKEMQAIRKDGWSMASRVLWQHDLSPEEAVAECLRQLKPQIDRMQSDMSDEQFAEVLKDGPIKPVNIEDAKGLYVEFEPKDPTVPEPPGEFILFDERDDDGYDILPRRF